MGSPPVEALLDGLSIIGLCSIDTEADVGLANNCFDIDRAVGELNGIVPGSGTLMGEPSGIDTSDVVRATAIGDCITCGCAKATRLTVDAGSAPSSKPLRGVGFFRADFGDLPGLLLGDSVSSPAGIMSLEGRAGLTSLSPPGITKTAASALSSGPNSERLKVPGGPAVNVPGGGCAANVPGG